MTLTGYEPRDRYGGWSGLQFEATGFFHVVKTDRWWLVTPEGNAYLSLGLNHVEPSIMTQPYNKGYWAQKLGLLTDAVPDAYLPGFRAKMVADMQRLGMTCLACHSPQDFYPASVLPYVYRLRFCDVCHWLTPTEDDFWDVFSPEFEVHCDAMARQYALPRRDDPLLMGYFFVDCPILTEMDAAPHGNNIYGQVRRQLPTWPRVLRAKGPSSPGKRAYVDTMRDLYHGDLAAFNATYDTVFGTWDALLDAVCWRGMCDPDNEPEVRDNAAFLAAALAKRYAVETAAVRRYDPNHMIFGDKINCNTDTSSEQLTLVTKYFDVTFLQYYALWEDHEAWMDRAAKVTSRPFLQGDGSISTPHHPNMPNPFGPHCRDEAERARQTERALRGALARPDFLGWHWCGWMDRWRDAQPNKQHSGLQDPFGNWHPAADVWAQVSRDLYAIAIGKA